MGDRNFVEIIGTLASTPMIKKTKAGKDYSVFVVVTKYQKGSKEWSQQHTVQTWQVETLNGLVKGDRVRVEGRLDYQFIREPTAMKIAYVVASLIVLVEKARREDVL